MTKNGGSVGGGGEGGPGLKKGPWTAAEDAILVEYVRKHGEGNWNAVQRHSGLSRCGKSCRLRWANHLRPNLKKGPFSPDEEILILRLHAALGNKWARISSHLPGRTDNEIKNYWNTRLKRRQRSGIPLYPPEIERDVGFHRQGGLGSLPLPDDSPPPHPTVSNAELLFHPNSIGFSSPPAASLATAPLLGQSYPYPNQIPPGLQLFQFSSSPNSAPLYPQKMELAPGNYGANPASSLYPSFSAKMELPSTQMFPDPVASPVLQEEQPQLVRKEREANWVHAGCGGGDGGGNGGGTPAQGIALESVDGWVASDCLDAMRSAKEPAESSMEDISHLFDTMPARATTTFPEWFNDSREPSNGQSSGMTDDGANLGTTQAFSSSLPVTPEGPHWSV